MRWRSGGWRGGEVDEWWGGGVVGGEVVVEEWWVEGW